LNDDDDVLNLVRAGGRVALRLRSERIPF